MDVLINLIVNPFTIYTYIKSFCILKHITILFVNYTSIKLEKNFKETEVTNSINFDNLTN